MISADLIVHIPNSMTAGVIKVKIAVDKIPSPSVYFPPYFVDKIPPGMCVMALKCIVQIKIIK